MIDERDGAGETPGTRSKRFLLLRPGEPLELVLRGDRLARRGLHDGDVVRVLPGTAGGARPGDLVAAVTPGGALTVGVLSPSDPDGGAGPVLRSDWDGPAAAAAGAYLLGVAQKVRLVRAGNLPRRVARGFGPRRLGRPGRPVERVPVPYRREAQPPQRPRRPALVLPALAALVLPALAALNALGNLG